MADYFAPLVQTTYEKGNCDFCMQRDVKVKPLKCKRHFYCRTCNEFSPKFKRKDFQCTKCSERCRRNTNENLHKVDVFLDSKTGGCKERQKDIAVSVDGGNLITFGDEHLDDDEENDLSGNNDEWEYLLEAVSKKEETVPRQLEFLPRKTSFIHFTLPTTEMNHLSETDQSPMEKLICREKDEENKKSPVQQVQPSLEDLSDSSEEEKCTSPVKRSGRRKPALGWFPRSHFCEEEDEHIELLTDIEAPPESPTFSDVSLPSLAHDTFWDF